MVVHPWLSRLNVFLTRVLLLPFFTLVLNRSGILTMNGLGVQNTTRYVRFILFHGLLWYSGWINFGLVLWITVESVKTPIKDMIPNTPNTGSVCPRRDLVTGCVHDLVFEIWKPEKMGNTRGLPGFVEVPSWCMTKRYRVVPYDKPGISLCSFGIVSYRFLSSFIYLKIVCPSARHNCPPEQRYQCHTAWHKRTAIRTKNFPLGCISG